MNKPPIGETEVITVTEEVEGGLVTRVTTKGFTLIGLCSQGLRVSFPEERPKVLENPSAVGRSSIPNGNGMGEEAEMFHVISRRLEAALAMDQVLEISELCPSSSYPDKYLLISESSAIVLNLISVTLARSSHTVSITDSSGEVSNLKAESSLAISESSAASRIPNKPSLESL